MLVPALYNSTHAPCWPKLSVGGYLIIDDYGGVPNCQEAVDDYRQQQGITEEIQKIDWTGVFWKRTR